MPSPDQAISVVVAIAFLLASACAAGLQSQTPAPLAMAQKQIDGYLEQLGNVHCTETVTQEKLDEKGHILDVERGTFDYLIMMSGNASDFQLNESRLEVPGARRKLLAVPMLVTNGIATVLLVFHSYYRDAFTFTIGADELINGAETIPIHFTHIPGRRTPAALALRGREYPLDLEGTAWLNAATRQVIRVDANLEHDMSDVGLRSLQIQVEYKSEPLSGRPSAIDLPALAVVDVVTPRQHWRNTHKFGDYKSFSTGVQESTTVTILPGANGSAAGQTPDPSSKEPAKQP